MAESNSQTVTLSAATARRSSCRCSRARIGPERDRHPQALRRHRAVHLRPGLHLHRELHVEDHLHRRRGRHPAASRLLDRGSGRPRATSSRSPTCSCTASCRPREQKAKFVHDITYHTMLHEQIMYLFRGFRRDAHPMAVMIAVVGALSAFYHEDLDIDDPHNRMIASYRLIAKMPTIAAMAYKYSVGQPFMYPRNDLTYAENFLHMMFARAVRAVQGQPGARQGARPHLHPARRPRAERLDLDRAPGRLDRRQPVRRDRRRHRLAVGPGAWRRQRGGAQHAARRSARSTASPSSSPAPRTATTRSG